MFRTLIIVRGRCSLVRKKLARFSEGKASLEVSFCFVGSVGWVRSTWFRKREAACY